MNKITSAIAALFSIIGGTAMASPLTGRFGSNDARLEIRSDGATLDLSCASATINGVPRVDRRGNFTARGTFEMASGGPQHVDESGTGHPARFSGKLRGDRLTLVITPSHGVPLTLQLNRNSRMKLVRCL